MAAASLRKNAFSFAVVAAVGAARLAPWVGASGGPLHWAAKPLVSVVFFASGLSLRTKELRAAAGNVRAHAVAQLFTFLAFPLAVAAAVRALPPALLGPELSRGMVALACLPPPVSTAVILTRVSGGSEAVAIFNSTVGSLVGVVASPFLLAWFLAGGGGAAGAPAPAPAGDVLLGLGGSVVMPLVAGQLLQARLGPDRTARLSQRLGLGRAGSAVLLFIIFCTFCDTFSQSDAAPDGASAVTRRQVVTAAVCVCGIHGGVLLAAAALLPAAGFSRKDVAALMWICSHKSLTLGLPLLRLVFASDDMLALPLLLYHPAQIVIGGSIAPELRPWVAGERADKRGVPAARSVEMV